MLKFLFGKKDQKAQSLTQRESFANLLGELNSLIAAQPEAPKIVIDPASGQIDLQLPEQLADEALALPAPVKEDTSTVDETAEVEAKKDAA